MDEEPDLSPEQKAKADMLVERTVDLMRICYAESGLSYSFIDGPNGGREPLAKPMEPAQ